LRVVDWHQALNGLKLHNQTAFHHHVQSVATIEPHALIDHGQRNLALEGQPCQIQFVTQTLFIGRFEQPRTKHAMNFNGCSDNFPGQGILFRIYEFLSTTETQRHREKLANVERKFV
jgi:hypothetical protein